jgi:hypothetical protein
MTVSTFDYVNQYYDLNAATLSSAANSLSAINSDSAAYDRVMSTVEETAQIVIRRLDFLGNLHPVLSCTWHLSLRASILDLWCSRCGILQVCHVLRYGSPRK